MSDGKDEKDFVTAREVARHCHVTQRAVAKWVEQGKLNAYRTPGGRIRVKREEFVAFLDKYSMSVPLEYNKTHVKPRILIVDDEVNIVNAVKRLLKRNGDYEFEKAYDGFEAGMKLITFKPDLMILDIKMPGMDGYDVLNRIREEGTVSPRIIVYSGVLPEELCSEMLDLGVDACLSKTDPAELMIQAVKRLAG
jgi:two-component system response regulator VicR